MRQALMVVLALASALFATVAQARQPPLTAEESNPSQVVEAPGFDKQQIYQGAKVWIAENFRSAKAVMEYDNPDDGVLIGNGNTQFPCGGFSCVVKSDWRVSFTMKVETKDARFRVSFSNLRITWPPSYSGGVVTPAGDVPVNSRKDMDAIRAQLMAFGPSIRDSLSAAKPSDDW